MDKYGENDRVHKDDYPDTGTVVPTLEGFSGSAPRGFAFIQWDRTGVSIEPEHILRPADQPTFTPRIAHLANDFSPDMDPAQLMVWAIEVVQTIKGAPAGGSQRARIQQVARQFGWTTQESRLGVTYHHNSAPEPTASAIVQYRGDNTVAAATLKLAGTPAVVFQDETDIEAKVISYLHLYSRVAT